MNIAKQWCLAVRMYAADENGQAPTNFDAAAAYLPKENTDTNFNLNQFEVVFQGSLNAVKNPSQTIILREKEPEQEPNGRWAKAYGFADGHVEIHGEPQNDFGAFEQKHSSSQ